MSDILNRPNSAKDLASTTSTPEDTMSYADIASKGPKQSDAEKAAPALPEVEHSDSDAGVQSLDSLTSESGVHAFDPTSSHGRSTNNAIPSYAEQQRAHEAAQRAEQDAARAADQISRDAAAFTQKAEQDLKALEARGETKAREARGKYEAVKKEAKAEAGKVKDVAKDAEDWAEKNKGNPVVVGNAVVVTALAGLLGVGAYRLHARHALTWKIAGLWAGAVGLFAVGDYYVSQYLFKNKYPTKK